MANERLPEQSIPDRSPGHAFVPIAHAGRCRHTKVRKARVVVWYSELARGIPLRPNPTPAGDKPPRYRIPAVAGTTMLGRFRWLEQAFQEFQALGRERIWSWGRRMPDAAGYGKPLNLIGHGLHHNRPVVTNALQRRFQLIPFKMAGARGSPGGYRSRARRPVYGRRSATASASDTSSMLAWNTSINMRNEGLSTASTNLATSWTRLQKLVS